MDTGYRGNAASSSVKNCGRETQNREIERSEEKVGVRAEEQGERQKQVWMTARGGRRGLIEDR